MATFFKEKSYYMAHSLLQNTGFFNSDIIYFRIQGIAAQIAEQPFLFEPLVKVLESVKLNPLRILKIQLLLQRLLQISPNMQENDSLMQLLLKLGDEVNHLIRPVVNLNVSLFSGPQMKLNSNKLRSEGELVQQNEVTLLLKKIVEPFLELQKRLVFSYDLVSPQPGTEHLELSECWAVLNLLKKFVEFSPQIDIIGRYYSKAYATSILYLIKVMNCDIQLLYHRISKFACKKIEEYAEMVNKGMLNNLSIDQQTRIQEFLQLLKQIDGVNELIKSLYMGRSVKANLAANQIRMPTLFTSDSYIHLIYCLEKTVPPRIPLNCLPSSKNVWKDPKMSTEVTEA